MFQIGADFVSAFSENSAEFSHFSVEKEPLEEEESNEESEEREENEEKELEEWKKGFDEQEIAEKDYASLCKNLNLEIKRLLLYRFSDVLCPPPDCKA